LCERVNMSPPLVYSRNIKCVQIPFSNDSNKSVPDKLVLNVVVPAADGIVDVFPHERTDTRLNDFVIPIYRQIPQAQHAELVVVFIVIVRRNSECLVRLVRPGVDDKLNFKILKRIDFLNESRPMPASS